MRLGNKKEHSVEIHPIYDWTPGTIEFLPTISKWCDKGRTPWFLVARFGVWDEASLER